MTTVYILILAFMLYNHLITYIHTFDNKTYTLSIYHETLRTMNNDGIFVTDIIITGNTIPSGAHPLTEKLFRPNKIYKLL